MMVPLLASLDAYHAALLLITLTSGGKEQRRIFALLPEESRRLLEEKAESLLGLPSEKRVAVMVHELKLRLVQQGRRGIEHIDQSWILHRLRGESPSVVGLLLLHLAPQQSRAVVRRLPDAVRHSLPPKHVLASVPNVIAQGLRLMFEASFDPMPEPQLLGPKSLQDIIELERDDMFVVVRDLGLTELGQAFASVEKMALIELVRRLPKKEAKELISAVKSAAKVEPLDPRQAQLFLSRVVENFEDTETLLRRSGLWRMARALCDEPLAFLRALYQRLPRQAGAQLEEYVERAKELEHSTGETVQRLQDAILVRLMLLARDRRISSRWADADLAFFDPEACKTALEAQDKISSSATGTDELADSTLSLQALKED